MMLNICLHAYFPNTCLFHEMSGWTIFHLDYFFPAEFRQSLYSKYHPLMKIHCENISCHSVVCLFHSLIVSFTKQAFLLLMKYFIFMGCALMSWQKSFCPALGPEDFFSKRFIVLDFTHGCMVHFAIFLKFLYKVWNLGQDSVICLGISNCP